MTVLEWLQELEEEERIVKVGCVDNTLRGLRRCTARMAAASYLHWACPEYLAPQLGLAFECKSPAVNNKPKPRPLNQGGGFRKTGHNLPII